MLKLLKPSLCLIPEYVEALERGWSPVVNRGPQVAREHIDTIRENAGRFVELQNDVQAIGGPVFLPDGTAVPRLPSFSRWLWDGEFCGTIYFRWQDGTSQLPPYVMGHVGYTIAPWKRQRGYATRGLGLLLDELATLGLEYIEIVTEPDNLPSQKVIIANGGVLTEKFITEPAYGSTEALRFRIDLPGRKAA